MKYKITISCEFDSYDRLNSEDIRLMKEDLTERNQSSVIEIFAKEFDYHFTSDVKVETKINFIEE